MEFRDNDFTLTYHNDTTVIYTFEDRFPDYDANGYESYYITNTDTNVGFIINLKPDGSGIYFDGLGDWTKQ